MAYTKAGETLSTLSWVDAHDRLDTLILEIRHLQINIINSLREPILYRALRFEEAYIWLEAAQTPAKRASSRPRPAGYWAELLLRRDLSPRDLARSWVIQYPHPTATKHVRGPDQGEHPGLDDTGRTQREAIDTRIRERVDQMWQNRMWSMDQKRHYHSLSTLQQLKANVLKDKLTLAHWALRAFGGGWLGGAAWTDRDRAREQARFMLLRAAAMARAWQYVERLGDLQAQFEKSMDMSLQDDPRPQLERRREQGLYTSFLADRSRDLHGEISRLVHGKYGVCDGGERDDVLIMHRWVHDFSSHSEVFIDEVKLENREPGTARVDAGFVNTSYWMPERPDLQSVIGHEVAHTVIYDCYRDFQPDALVDKRDYFSSLLRQLGTALHVFGVRAQWSPGDPRNETSYALPEIAADLLAGTVQGHEYLIALFLELTGQGLEGLFDVGVDRIELDRVGHLEGSAGRDDSHRDWYLRLHLLCSWLDQVHHRPKKSDLDRLAIDGVREVLDNILNYLAELVPGTDVNPDRDIWRVLTARMCRIAETSRAAELAREWRRERSEDYQRASGAPGPRLLPRCTRRLQRPVRDFLFRMMLARKQRRSSNLQGELSPSEFLREFDKRFFPTYSTGAQKDWSIGDRQLFQHYYDIPWQCALMRAMELRETAGVGGARGSTELMRELHCDTALGRELYQIAIDFFFRKSRSAYVRLQLAVRFVENHLEAFSGSQEQDPEAPDFKEELSRWLDGDASNTPHDQGVREAWDEVCSLTDVYDKTFAKGRRSGNAFREDANPIVERRSARVWLAVHPAMAIFAAQADATANTKRMVEKLQGYKLQDLFACLNAAVDRGLEARVPAKARGFVLALRGYLATRSKQSDDRLLKLLTTSLTPSGGLEHSPGPVLVDLTMIGRITLCGSYPGPAQDRLPPDAVLPYDHWLAPGVNCINSLPEDAPKASHRHYQSVLGRYDLVAFFPTRPMCRCGLPAFPQQSARRTKSGTPDMETARDRPPSDERFPSFFVRRELAYPVRLDIRKDLPPMEETAPFIALLAVVLTQRQSRLDMVHRLVQICSQSDHNVEARRHVAQQLDAPNTTPFLEQVGGLFHPNDRLYLTEGWGDLLLVFSSGTKPEQDQEPQHLEERLGEVFAIKSAIFHDVLVDRTELILAPIALGVAASSPKYDISTRLRLVEGRLGAGTIDDFIAQILENVGTQSPWRAYRPPAGAEQDPVKVVHTPGRTDLTLSFADFSGQDVDMFGSKGMQFRHIAELINGQRSESQSIDMIATTIGVVRNQLRRPG